MFRAIYYIDILCNLLYFGDLTIYFGDLTIYFGDLTIYFGDLTIYFVVIKDLPNISFYIGH